MFKYLISVIYAECLILSLNASIAQSITPNHITSGSSTILTGDLITNSRGQHVLRSHSHLNKAQIFQDYREKIFTNISTAFENSAVKFFIVAALSIILIILSGTIAKKRRKARQHNQSLEHGKDEELVSCREISPFRNEAIETDDLFSDSIHGNFDLNPQISHALENDATANNYLAAVLVKDEHNINLTLGSTKQFQSSSITPPKKLMYDLELPQNPLEDLIDDDEELQDIIQASGTSSKPFITSTNEEPSSSSAMCMTSIPKLHKKKHRRGRPGRGVVIRRKYTSSERYFDSIKEAAKFMEADASTVGKIAAGKGRSTAGYEVRYENESWQKKAT